MQNAKSFDDLNFFSLICYLFVIVLVCFVSEEKPCHNISCSTMKYYLDVAIELTLKTAFFKLYKYAITDIFRKYENKMCYILELFGFVVKKKITLIRS